jgi:hypothetical protein
MLIPQLISLLGNPVIKQLVYNNPCKGRQNGHPVRSLLQLYLKNIDEIESFFGRRNIISYLILMPVDFMFIIRCKRHQEEASHVGCCGGSRFIRALMAYEWMNGIAPVIFVKRKPL